MGQRCQWCGRPLPTAAATGRPRQFCRAGCRQQAHLARKFAAAHGLGDDDVIVDRRRLDDLNDGLYCLQAAIEDIDQDLVGTPTAADVSDALRWLLENARPLVAARINPKAVDLPSA